MSSKIVRTPLKTLPLNSRGNETNDKNTRSTEKKQHATSFPLKHYIAPNEYQIKFPSGPMGLELEPVSVNDNPIRKIGCKVKSFHCDANSCSIRYDILMSEIGIGDIVAFVNNINVNCFQFEDILSLLKHNINKSKVLVFRKLSSGESNSQVNTPSTNPEVKSSHISMDVKNVDNNEIYLDITSSKSSSNSSKTHLRNQIMDSHHTDIDTSTTMEMLKTLFPARYDAIAKLLSDAGSGVGTGLLHVGGVVASNAGRIIGSAVQHVPCYSLQDIHAIERKCHLLLQELSKTCLLLGECDNKCDKLRKERDDFFQKSNMDGQARARLEHSSKTLMTRLEDTLLELAAVQADRDVWMDTCKVTQELLMQARESGGSDVEEAYSVIDGMKKQLELHLNSINELTNQLDHQSAVQQQKELQFKQHEKENKLKLATLQSEYDIVYRERDNVVAENEVLRDMIEVHKQSVENEKNSLRENMNKYQKSYSDRLVSVDQEILECNNTNRELEATVEQLRTSQSKMHQENLRLKEDLNNAKNVIAQQSQTCSHQEVLLRELSNKFERLQLNLQDDNYNRHVLEADIVKYQTNEVVMHENAVQLNNEINRLTANYNEILSELRAAQFSIISLQHQNEQFQESKNDFEQKCIESCDSLKIEFESQRQGYVRKIEELDSLRLKYETELNVTRDSFQATKQEWDLAMRCADDRENSLACQLQEIMKSLNEEKSRHESCIAQMVSVKEENVQRIEELLRDVQRTRRLLQTEQIINRDRSFALNATEKIVNDQQEEINALKHEIEQQMAHISYIKELNAAEAMKHVKREQLVSDMQNKLNSFESALQLAYEESHYFKSLYTDSQRDVNSAYASTHNGAIKIEQQAKALKIELVSLRQICNENIANARSVVVQAISSMSTECSAHLERMRAEKANALVVTELYYEDKIKDLLLLKKQAEEESERSATMMVHSHLLQESCKYESIIQQLRDEKLMEREDHIAVQADMIKALNNIEEEKKIMTQNAKLHLEEEAESFRRDRALLISSYESAIQADKELIAKMKDEISSFRVAEKEADKTYALKYMKIQEEIVRKYRDDFMSKITTLTETLHATSQQLYTSEQMLIWKDQDISILQQRLQSTTYDDEKVLRSKILELETEIVILKENLLDHRLAEKNTISDYEMKIELLAQKNRDMTDAFALELEREKADLNMELLQKNSDLLSLQNSVAMLNSTLTNEVAIRDRLQEEFNCRILESAKLHKKENDAKQVERNTCDIEHRRSTELLCEALDEVRGKLQVSVNQSNELREQISSLEKTNTLLQSDSSRLAKSQTEVSFLQQENRRLQLENMDILQSKSDLEKQINVFRSGFEVKLFEVEKQYSQLQQEHTEAVEKLKVADETNLMRIEESAIFEDALVNRQRELQEHIDTLQEEVINVKASLSVAKAARTQTEVKSLAEKKKYKQEFQSQLNDVIARKDELQITVDYLNVQVSQLQSSIVNCNAMKIELETSRGLAKESEQQCTWLRAELKRKEDDYTRISDENSAKMKLEMFNREKTITDMSVSMEAMKIELQCAQGELMKKQQNVSLLENQLSVKEERIISLGQHISDLDKLVSSTSELQVQYEQVRVRSQTLAAKNVKLETLLNQSKEDMAATLEESTSRLQNEISLAHRASCLLEIEKKQLETSTINLLTQLKASKTLLEEKDIDFMSRFNGIMEKNRTLEKQLQSSVSSLDILAKELNGLEAQNKYLVSNNETLQKDIENLNAQSLTSTKDLETLRSRCGQLVEVMGQQQGVINDANAQQSLWIKNRENLMSVISDLRDKNNQLQSKLYSLSTHGPLSETGLGGTNGSDIMTYEELQRLYKSKCKEVIKLTEMVNGLAVEASKTSSSVKSIHNLRADDDDVISLTSTLYEQQRAKEDREKLVRSSEGTPAGQLQAYDRVGYLHGSNVANSYRSDDDDNTLCSSMSSIPLQSDMNFEYHDLQANPRHVRPSSKSELHDARNLYSSITSSLLTLSQETDNMATKQATEVLFQQVERLKNLLLLSKQREEILENMLVRDPEVCLNCYCEDPSTPFGRAICRDAPSISVSETKLTNEIILRKALCFLFLNAWRLARATSSKGSKAVASSIGSPSHPTPSRSDRFSAREPYLFRGHNNSAAEGIHYELTGPSMRMNDDIVLWDDDAGVGVGVGAGVGVAISGGRCDRERDREGETPPSPADSAYSCNSEFFEISSEFE